MFSPEPFVVYRLVHLHRNERIAMGPRHLRQKSRLELLCACTICLSQTNLTVSLGRRRVLPETC